MLETPDKFLVICSTSFKKSPEIDFFSQLLEKNHTYELTPIVYGKKIHCIYSLDMSLTKNCHSERKVKIKIKFSL
jgi:hypothetical protein